MKKLERNIIVYAITLVIVGLVITSTASVISQELDTKENKLITKLNKINIKPMDSTYSQPMENKKVYSQPSEMVGIPLFSGITPALSDSGSSMVVGFNSLDQENVYFAGSTDFGETWTDGLGWGWEEPPELPDVDGCGDGRFIGTMVPSYYFAEGSAMAKVEISDASDVDNGYSATYWDWYDVGAGYTGFIDLACGGYTAEDPEENEWAYGGFSIIGDHGELGDQTCFFSYQCNEAGTAWIYTLTDEPGSLNDATSTGMDIDQDTLYSYAVYNYDNQGTMDIYVFVMDFGQWGEYSGYPIHENNWGIQLNTSGNDNKLDVSAFKNNVIIVSERDGDIIAYYGDDPLQNDFSETTIIADADDPRISHIDENKAVCEFIKDEDLYYAFTEDGGVTWTTQGQVSEEENVLSGDGCAYGYAYEAEEIIYFAPTDFSQPILQIDSISGAIGISAIVKNVGTAAAENVDWSIVTEGIVFIGGEKSGQITLQPGETKTIKTGLMLGFGNIDVTVTLDTMTKTASGKLLLFFIIGLE